MAVIDPAQREPTRESFERLLANSCTKTDLRRIITSGDAHDPALWSEIAPLQRRPRRSRQCCSWSGRAWGAEQARRDSQVRQEVLVGTRLPKQEKLGSDPCSGHRLPFRQARPSSTRQVTRHPL